jgi:hypothetical protein
MWVGFDVGFAVGGFRGGFAMGFTVGGFAVVSVAPRLFINW